MLMPRLENRKILVTGGASGIGRATCELFAREGAAVAVIDRDAARFGTARAIAADVSDPASVARAVRQAAQVLGGLDGLVNASGVGLLPTGGGSTAYVASKGGVIAMTRTLAAELAPAIRVNAVCPGAVETPMTDGTLRDAAGAVIPAIVQRYALGRPAAPEEIAAAILFLTAHESSFVTGISLPVDGGRTYH
jgi:NAD(P)-dependent dehydrogenase (short-subunit alcohol dehydrogenase family)